jgi:hypothetical protein
MAKKKVRKQLTKLNNFRQLMGQYKPIDRALLSTMSYKEGKIIEQARLEKYKKSNDNDNKI